MSCPVCRGEQDPRRLLLETLCPAHLAVAELQAQAVLEDDLLSLLEHEALPMPLLHPWPLGPKFGAYP